LEKLIHFPFYPLILQQLHHLLFFGDFPALLALAVNFEGEPEVYFLEGDANAAPPILLGELPPAIVACFLILRPGESYS
jgi:hypothetical protein